MYLKIKNRGVNIDDNEARKHIGEITEESCLMYISVFFNTSTPEIFVNELPQDELESAINTMIKNDNLIAWKDDEK